MRFANRNAKPSGRRQALRAGSTFLAILEAVQRCGRAVLEGTLDTVHDALEAVKPPLDAAPARRDQLDE
jgi:hypothetical protein